MPKIVSVETLKKQENDFITSLGNGRVSRVEGHRSRVISRGSRVIGRGSKVEVEGQKSRSRVKSRGRGSKVEGRKSKILNFYPFQKSTIKRGKTISFAVKTEKFRLWLRNLIIGNMLSLGGERVLKFSELQLNLTILLIPRMVLKR